MRAWLHTTTASGCRHFSRGATMVTPSVEISDVYNLAEVAR